MGPVNGWRRVMDVRYNPLKYIPDPSLQTYFMLVLFVVWSIFLGLVAANYLGGLVITLWLVLLYIVLFYHLAFTNAILIDAERDGHKWLKEWKEEQNRWTCY